MSSESHTRKFNEANRSRDIPSQQRDKMNPKPLKTQRIETNIIKDVNVKVITEHLFCYLY